MINLFIIIIVLSNLVIAQLDAKLIADDFEKPLYITNYPNNNDILLVIEQEGIIKIVENNQITKIPFLDISDRVHQPLYPADEMGMLGIAFDPNFNKNHFFYINYVNKDSYSIISRFKVIEKLGNSQSEEILIKLKQPYPNHNGGSIEFGPDGYLYIATGDGGSSGDPEENAQNLSSLLGKILRIDVNEKLYKVPKDNPFLNQTNAKPEIWAYGLRNPWKFSFSMIDNTMFIADVGQNSWEELNVQDFRLPGLNYGWNLKEGKSIFKKNSLENLTDPLIQYSSNASYGKTLAGLRQTIDAVGCSITGGYSYHGEINDIKEQYFFGDYCTGKIWSIKNYTSPNFEIIDWTQELIGNKKQLYISSFGRDFYGELYLADHSGSIYKIVK